MAKIRCSNCEKSVDIRQKDGKICISTVCRSTGEKISNSARAPKQKSPYYQVRNCNEFLPRKEYVNQFENPLDKAMDVIDKGKRIKDILEP